MLLPTESGRFLIRESPFTDSSSRECICSDCTRESDDENGVVCQDLEELRMTALTLHMKDRRPKEGKGSILLVEVNICHMCSCWTPVVLLKTHSGPSFSFDLFVYDVAY
ncbi:hypothetical protein MDA_GLEAN10018824 [Myotis davidii]|uniref:Uncharacterized protein n=1 Tax=Myotis davidii TaxID=225400 RepID=L5M8Y9_MYODS|nr:hypothetical protein MDA_GLEAN10018824 [Myotis davidii]